MFNRALYNKNNFLYSITNIDILSCKNKIKIINIPYSNLSQLPNLDEFINLEILYCNNNKLTQLPKLPINLKYLYCENNKLIQLSKLPNSLIKLNCDNNKLTQLPKLSINLKNLYCNNNKLKQIPDLPDSLIELNCNDNLLIELPELPSNLTYLYCESNKLTQLPELPINLNHLYCHYNNIYKFPNLHKLQKLNILYSFNNKLNTLPKSILYCKNLLTYKKYKLYTYINKLNYLLNYHIKNYYYYNIMKYYNCKHLK